MSEKYLILFTQKDALNLKRALVQRSLNEN